jgi:hypothetical protein
LKDYFVPYTLSPVCDGEITGGSWEALVLPPADQGFARITFLSVSHEKHSLQNNNDPLEPMKYGGTLSLDIHPALTPGFCGLAKIRVSFARAVCTV